MRYSKTTKIPGKRQKKPMATMFFLAESLFPIKSILGDEADAGSHPGRKRLPVLAESQAEPGGRPGRAACCLTEHPESAEIRLRDRAGMASRKERAKDGLRP